VQGNGTYEYRLDEGPWQSDNVFTNVSSGTHVVTVRDITAINPCDDLIISGVSIVNYPKYFTPNGDGYHDYWNITGLDTQENADATIYIFDRYGKLVKQISPQGEGWDGTYNGRPLPGDDYWFSITYKETIDNTAVQKEFRAHFALKR
jgi:gliding motility-associated-like protein